MSGDGYTIPPDAVEVVGEERPRRWWRAARDGFVDGLNDFDSFVLTFVLLLWFGWWGILVRLALVPVSMLWGFLLAAAGLNRRELWGTGSRTR